MRRVSYSRKLMGDIWQFAMENKAYWIVPLVLMLALAALVVAGSQAASPFVYTLF